MDSQATHEENVLPDALVETSLALSNFTTLENNAFSNLSLPDVLTDFSSNESSVTCLPFFTSDQNYRNPDVVSDHDIESDLSTSSDVSEEVKRPVSRPDIHQSQRSCDLPLEIDPAYVPRLPKSPSSNVKLVVLGKVSSLLKGCVVVKSLPNMPALDRGSALYLENREPLGEVYDTIGLVRSPYYVVVHENRQPPPKLSKARNIPGSGKTDVSFAEKGSVETIGIATNIEGVKDAAETVSVPIKLKVEVKVGDKVLYAEDDPYLSIRILCSELSKLRGSDASGLLDQELSPDQQEFSDDEEEYAYKRKQMGKRPLGGHKSGQSATVRGRGNHLTFSRGYNPTALTKTRGGIQCPSSVNTSVSNPSNICQRPSLSSSRRSFLRPSYLQTQGVVRQQRMDFVTQQRVQYVPQPLTQTVRWNVSPTAYTWHQTQVSGWQSIDPNYYPQPLMVPRMPSHSSFQSPSYSTQSYNLEEIIEPTPFPAFSTGTPPTRDPPLQYDPHYPESGTSGRRRSSRR